MSSDKNRAGTEYMNKSASPERRKRARLWNIIYYLVAAAILVTTLCYMFSGRKVTSSQAFGTTSDARQDITEGMEIRTDFKISRNNFRGISIRFFEENEIQYGNESLYFYLKDNTTGEVVGDYVLDLKKALPQIGNFVPLPFEESEGKDVSLYISGKNIKICPSLCLSETADNKSELFVGSKHRRAYNLVFSAIYTDYQPLNFQAFVRGMVYFFLWMLVGLWPGIFRRAQKTAVPAGHRVSRFRLAAVCRKIRIPFLFVMMTLLYLLIAVFVYTDNVAFAMANATSAVVVEEDRQYRDRSIVLDSDDDLLTETFTAQQDKLSSLSFQVCAAKKNRGSMLHIQLFDAGNELVLHDEYCRVSSLPSVRSEWKMYLEKEYAASAGREIRICIEPVGFEASEVHFYIGEGKSLVKAMVGDKRTGNLPILKASYADYGFLRPLYRTFAILVYVFLVMSFLMILVLGWNVQKIYVPICLFLGVLYMLIIPVYSVPDEYAHIDTAYSLSNRLMGIGKPTMLEGYDYRREIDAETQEYYSYTATIDDYRRMYTEFKSAVPEQELTPCVMRSTYSNVSMLYFLPSAVGITLGRILQLPTIPVYLLGRFCNLIAYVLLTCLAVRRLPGMKEVFFLYATLPIGLQQAASYSYDCILAASALLFFAYCVYFSVGKDFPGPVDVFLLLFTSLQIVTVKGGVYAPLALFLLLIPLERRWKWIKNIPFFVMITGFIGLGFLQGNISSLMNRLLPGSGTHVSAFSGKEVYTLSYFIEKPMTLLSLYFNTFFMEGSRLVYEFFGGKMGSVKNIQMPWFYSCIFMVIMAVCVSRSRRDFALRRISRFICLAAPLLAILLIGLAMLLAHTPTDTYYITGLQGRYYIPIMMIMLLCLMDPASPERTSDVSELSQVQSVSADSNTETKADIHADDNTDHEDRKKTSSLSSSPNLLISYCLVHSIFLLNIIMVVMPIVIT